MPTKRRGGLKLCRLKFYLFIFLFLSFCRYAIMIQTDGVIVAGRVWNNTQNITVKIDDIPDYIQLSSLQPIGTPKVQKLTVNGQRMIVSQVKNK